jgi:hypothetical protein
MSRLRRPFLFDRYIFATVKLRPPRAWLQTSDYERLAASLARIRRKHRFAITAWVFLPGKAADPPITMAGPRYLLPTWPEAIDCGQEEASLEHGRKTGLPKSEIAEGFGLPLGAAPIAALEISP